jgi:histidinol dehydrogenase
MPAFLSTADPGFPEAFAALLARRAPAPDVQAEVGAIIAAVRARGDAALIELTRRFDRLELAPEALRIGPDEIAAALARADPDDRAALDLAARRIRDFHLRQLPADREWTDAAGATLGWRWTAVEAAGLYVPGGTAAYPSSVLMNAIPAKVAGVGRIVMCVPAPDGALNPLVLAAAGLAGVDMVFRIGGAQAIAAMAFGTATVPAVDKIVGPGNAWVAEAKRQVFGHVGIDTIAGPSEVLILAGVDNDPDWVALDLLAQAEHDESAQAILITDDAGFGRAVAAAVAARLAALPRGAIAGASWAAHGAVITVRDWDEAAALADRIAPEHLEILTPEPEALARRIRHAGAIFLGPWTPEAIGDYVGGPNHVLPTARAARFASGLSVMDFLKRTTIARMTPASLAAVGPAAERLAAAEGLAAHGQSVRARLERCNAEPRE